MKADNLRRSIRNCLPCAEQVEVAGCDQTMNDDFSCLHHTYAACLGSRILYSTEIALEAQFADPLTHGGECYCRVGV